MAVRPSSRRLAGSSSVPLPEYIVQLGAEHASLQRQAEQFHKTSGAEAMQGVTIAMDELQGLSGRPCNTPAARINADVWG